MGRERLRKAFKREYSDKMPHQLLLDHPEFISDVTGINYNERPLDASLKFHEIYEIENGGPLAFSNDPVKPDFSAQGQTVETENGGLKTDVGGGRTEWYLKSPFKTVEELLKFDADPFGKDAGKAMYPEYALRNFQWLFKENWDGRIEEDIAGWKKIEDLYPGKFTPGAGFYTTAFMWPIMIFGWDLFLEAGGLYPAETGALVKRFSLITKKFFEYAAQSNYEFIAPHDDIAMSTGPVFHPNWYKKYIFPVYEEVYEPMRKAGKYIVFLSDGNLVPFLDDIKELNPDGILFEPHTDLNAVIEKLGKNKIIIGNIDCRVLESGTKADVIKEVKRVTDAGRDIPGFIPCCTNTIQRNVPLENVYAYFEAIEKYRVR